MVIAIFNLLLSVVALGGLVSVLIVKPKGLRKIRKKGQRYFKTRIFTEHSKVHGWNSARWCENDFDFCVRLLMKRLLFRSCRN